MFGKPKKNSSRNWTLENVPDNHFISQPFQLDLLSSAFEHNTILYDTTDSLQNFIVLNILRESHADNHKKVLLYITNDNATESKAAFLSRHTPYKVDFHNKSVADQPIKIHLSTLCKWCECDVLVLSLTCLSDLLVMPTFIKFVRRNIYVLVHDECEQILEADGHVYQNLIELVSPPKKIICFTRQLLPEDLTDPVETTNRINRLEELTNCRLETASKLLTLLCLGAQPKTVLLPTSPSSPPNRHRMHTFANNLLDESADFFADLAPFIANQQSTPPITTATDSRGRPVCVFDYCKRAIGLVRALLDEFGLWCSALVAGVFVKHLIGIDQRRAQQQLDLIGEAAAASEQDQGEFKTSTSAGDQVARLVRFTATQLRLIASLFQTQDDQSPDLDAFHAMISPKLLTLIQHLKMAHKKIDFKIEVATLLPNRQTVPTATSIGSGRSRRPRRRKHAPPALTPSASCTSSIYSVSSSSSSSALFMSSSSSCSLSSDEYDEESRNSSRSSSMSRKTLAKLDCMTKKRTTKKGKASSLSHIRTDKLTFIPAHSTLTDPRYQSQSNSQVKVIYRAVAVDDCNDQQSTTMATTNGTDVSESQPPPPLPQQICGLVLVNCQFAAFSLSRLLDELCVWDPDLYFIRPGHLFTYQGHRQQSDSGSNRGDSPSTTTAAATITQFRNGSVNLLMATPSVVHALTQDGAQLPKCNLIVHVDPPVSLADLLLSKSRLKLIDQSDQSTQVIYLVDDETTAEGGSRLVDLQQMEQLLIKRCRSYPLFEDEHDIDASRINEILAPPAKQGDGATTKASQTPISQSINLINKFCARLPSDYLTKLTPRWRIVRVPLTNAVVPLNDGGDPNLPSHGPGAGCGAIGELDKAKEHGLFQCFLRLPINSPLKEEIAGWPMACKKLAKISAAHQTMQLLSSSSSNGSSRRKHQVSLKIPQRPQQQRSQTNTATTSDDIFSDSDAGDQAMVLDDGLPSAYGQRRNYFKKIPSQLTNCFPQSGSPSPNYLYCINITLTRPSLARSRRSASRIKLYYRHYKSTRPGLSHDNDDRLVFGVLTSKQLQHIPGFPLFTRAGDEFVQFTELWSPSCNQYRENICEQNGDRQWPQPGKPLTDEQLNQLVLFHRVIFQDVLHLEKSDLHEFGFRTAESQLLIVPIDRNNGDIAWDFLAFLLACRNQVDGTCRIDARRFDITDKPPVSPIFSVTSSSSKKQKSSKTSPNGSINRRQIALFDFRSDDYNNSVVVPSYRNMDRPQYYYVVRSRNDLSPLTPFPSNAYPSFAAYYGTKYAALISTSKQPLIDVDSTTLRLNLLVPRNLPSTSHQQPNGFTGRRAGKSSHDKMIERRERHKQLLVPELCLRHPVPTSLWFQAVCLPSILHRLQSLLACEELRCRIAVETGLGLAAKPQLTTNQLFEPLGEDLLLSATDKTDSCDQLTQSMTESDSSVGRRRRNRRKQSKPLIVTDKGDAPATSSVPLSTWNHDDSLSKRLSNVALDSYDDDDDDDDDQVTATSRGGGGGDTNSDSDSSVDSFEEGVQFFPSHDAWRVTPDPSESQISYRPGPASLLSALTLSSALDFVNLERLETIGDSFLKFAVTVHLFLKHPNVHEGKLSRWRSRVVCNPNLYTLGRAKQLPCSLITQPFDPSDNWIPPGYSTRKTNPILNRLHRQYPHLHHRNGSGTRRRGPHPPKVIWSTDALMDDEILRDIDDRVKEQEEDDASCSDGATNNTSNDASRSFEVGVWDPNDANVIQSQRQFHHHIATSRQLVPDKSVADCVEALIGAYLIGRGENSALRLMNWFGIECYSTDTEAEVTTNGSDTSTSPPMATPWRPPSIQRYDRDPKLLQDAHRAYSFDLLEAKLNYTFQDPSLLIQAFTHPSYRQLRRSHLTNPMLSPFCSYGKKDVFLTDNDCYQRLEFLGDAVLDYLITRLVFEDSSQHSPGLLTDLRSALVNNNIFAALAVKLDLHKFLRSSSPRLTDSIDAYVRWQKTEARDRLDFLTYDTDQLTASDGPSTRAGDEIVDDLEIPKVLADLFESLAGAVFLDAKLDLNVVWTVFHPFMRERIEHYTANVPKAPVRLLMELVPSGTEFELTQRLPDGRYEVCVNVFGKGKFYGQGRNYRLAKGMAAKRALRFLRSTQHRKQSATTRTDPTLAVNSEAAAV